MLPFSFGESPAFQLCASRTCNHTLHLVFFDRRISFPGNSRRPNNNAAIAPCIGGPAPRLGVARRGQVIAGVHGRSLGLGQPYNGYHVSRPYTALPHKTLPRSCNVALWTTGTGAAGIPRIRAPAPQPDLKADPQPTSFAWSAL